MRRAARSLGTALGGRSRVSRTTDEPNFVVEFFTVTCSTSFDVAEAFADDRARFRQMYPRKRRRTPILIIDREEPA